ncbi:MAG: hypothetical protein EOO43_09705 [Flavobacterium sp.]|nr:MAG: hypothetical protein EOO43_09705 [Flavobacterium sp.]
MTNRIIIHLIDKEQGADPILIPSANLIDINDNINILTERLNDSFRKDEKVLRTEFTENRLAFQIGVRDFSENNTDQVFLNFSNNSIARMLDLLAGVNLATGGYFVYIQYVYRNTNYVGVFVVRDIEQIIFDKSEDADNFTVDTTTVINTDKLAMAVRIDIDRLNADQPRYLHFTKKQSHQSRYFIDWIEAELADKSSDDTLALIHLINSLNDDEFPINPETNARYESEDFRRHLLNHINSSGKIVRVKELSNTYWQNEDFLIDKAEELGLDINGEFQGVDKFLRRLNAYEIKSGKVKLIFSQKDIDDGIVFKGDNNQIIINSDELSQAFDELQ